MASQMLPTFEVDKEGLAKVWARKGKGFILTELIQNAWDEDVTRVDVTVSYDADAALAHINVEDDDPEGFTDLAHAYTLFAESEKKNDPKLRGRFNLGEKLVIALCVEASITTTKGTVTFTAEGRRHSESKRKRGSQFTGSVPMSRQDYDDMIAVLDQLIPPPTCETIVNGDALLRREPVKQWQSSLWTELADADGRLTGGMRKTSVAIYEPIGDEVPMIYELGIPVVETGDRWHIDVGQKVPLNVDRDNVPPPYLRDLRRKVLENTVELLTSDEAAESWVTAVAEDPRIKDQVLAIVLDKRFGENRVTFDPSDPEANKIAMSQGYTVVTGRALPAAVWANVRKHETMKPAGVVTPSPKPYSPGQGSTRATVPRERWTPGMERLEQFAIGLAAHLMGAIIKVEFVNDPDAMNFAATYGGGGSSGMLEFNYRVLGKKWFDRDVTDTSVLALIIHEFGHHYCSDHLDRAYLDALCRLGASATELALTDPEFFRR